MKNAALVVFKKEMARFFGDKRLLFTTVILPGLVIFIMYSVMGQAMSSTFDSKDDVFKLAVVNMPASLETAFSPERYEIEEVNISQADDIKKKISDKEYQLFIVFPENFDENLALFNGGNLRENAPNVEIYHNSADVKSGNAFSETTAILSSVEEQLSNVFNINYAATPEDAARYDTANDEELSGTLFAMVLPMLLMTLMYSSCVALAPESIAGEKERGTLATLLIAPIPRNQIIIGKVMALSVMALLSGMSNFIGTMLSMPMLMKGMENDMNNISAVYYSVTDYLFLILIILSTVILFITLISIFSTFAKTVKEASTLVMPMMIVVMIVSFASMYSTEAKTEVVWYLIPVYNAVQSMIGIFSFNAVPVNIAVTILINLICSCGGLVILTKMFNNENIMFSK